MKKSAAVYDGVAPDNPIAILFIVTLGPDKLVSSKEGVVFQYFIFFVFVDPFLIPCVIVVYFIYPITPCILKLF